MGTASSLHGPSPAADSFASARLYLITGARPDLGELLEAAVRGGVDLVQVREKELANDRPDLAVLVGADAVHLGQDDLPVASARRFGLPVGLSTHTTAELERAEADYIGVGPVFATPTKPGRQAVGLELVRHAAAFARTPWFAIGGIDEANVAEVVAAGASRIAVVRAITDAEDPERTARALREALEP
jgi:thiamine-phosphate pyrophosphorylase